MAYLQLHVPEEVMEIQQEGYQNPKHVCYVKLDTIVLILDQQIIQDLYLPLEVGLVMEHINQLYAHLGNIQVPISKHQRIYVLIVQQHNGVMKGQQMRLLLVRLVSIVLSLLHHTFQTHVQEAHILQPQVLRIAMNV